MHAVVPLIQLISNTYLNNGQTTPSLGCCDCGWARVSSAWGEPVSTRVVRRLPASHAGWQSFWPPAHATVTINPRFCNINVKKHNLAPASHCRGTTHHVQPLVMGPMAAHRGLRCCGQRQICHLLITILVLSCTSSLVSPATCPWEKLV